MLGAESPKHIPMQPVINSNPVLAWIFGITILIWVMSEMSRMFFRRPDREARRADRLSALVLNVCIWGGILFADIAAFRFTQFAMGGNRILLFAAGIALMLAGMAFRWYSIRVLGRFFTAVVAIQPGHEIVEAGPYRWLRHPSYTGALVTFLGFALAIGNWLSLLIIAIFTAIGYGYRISVEERALVAGLGEAYRAYMKRTKRIIPFVI
jgi:protein-S-isoprenylcysteine O-methyltransferase Ste14